MREVLFKAKRMDNGEWVEGIPIQTHIGLFICFEENPHYCHQYGYMEIDGIIKVDEDTLCQYTGLTDKNGKKIWEGDVVKINNDFTGTIIWHDDTAAFCISPNDDAHDLLLLSVYLDDYEVEIIGNIFDNPELLKED